MQNICWSLVLTVKDGVSPDEFVQNVSTPSEGGKLFARSWSRDGCKRWVALLRTKRVEMRSRGITYNLCTERLMQMLVNKPKKSIYNPQRRSIATFSEPKSSCTPSRSFLIIA